MKGRSEISDAAAVALVRAYKKYELQLAQTDERTQHTDGWQRVRQTWSALTDELNAEFAISIKTEQWKKKISNIKTNVKSKKGIAKRDGKVNWSLAEMEYDKLFARECSVSTNAGSDGARENSASVGPLSIQPKNPSDDDLNAANGGAQENHKSIDELLYNCSKFGGLFNSGVFDAANLVNSTTHMNFNDAAGDASADLFCNQLMAKMEPTMASSSSTNLVAADDKRTTRGTKRKLAAAAASSASNGTAANGGAFLTDELQQLLFTQQNPHRPHQNQQQSQQQQFFMNSNGIFNGTGTYSNGTSSATAATTGNSGVLQLQLQAAQAQVEAANIQKNASEKFLLTVERLNNSVSKFESFVGRLESFSMMANNNNNHGGGLYSMNSGAAGGMNLSSNQPQFPNQLMNNLVYQK